MDQDQAGGSGQNMGYFPPTPESQPDLEAGRNEVLQDLFEDAIIPERSDNSQDLGDIGDDAGSLLDDVSMGSDSQAEDVEVLPEDSNENEGLSGDQSSANAACASGGVDDARGVRPPQQLEEDPANLPSTSRGRPKTLPLKPVARGLSPKKKGVSVLKRSRTNFYIVNREELMNLFPELKDSKVTVVNLENVEFREITGPEEIPEGAVVLAEHCGEYYIFEEVPSPDNENADKDAEKDKHADNDGQS